MSKIDLVPVTGAQNISAINDNFQKVQDALNEKVLYRDNPRSEPNQVETDVDMNGKRLYNLPPPRSDGEPVRLKDVGGTQKNVRVSDKVIPPLPPAPRRRNKLMSFDHDGNPSVTLPSKDSATGLRLDLISYEGEISGDQEWSPIPAHEDTTFDVQTRALTNRIEVLRNARVDYIAEARDLVSQVNKSIERVKTSAGITLPLSYSLDPSDSSSSDDGFNVVVAIDGGRYKPADLAYFDIRHAGAKVDNSTDDSDALRLALKRSTKIIVTGRMYINQLVDIPANADFQGVGRYRSAIVLGPNGALRFAGENIFSGWVGDIQFSDIGLVAQDGLPVTDEKLIFINCRGIIFNRSLTYNLISLFDNSHHCQYRGTHLLGSKVRSRCSSGSVSEALGFYGTYLGGTTIDCVDTVEPTMIGCVALGGAYTLKTGIARSPHNFYMGPVLHGNIIDSTDDVPIDIYKGGTSANITGNFISGGRSSGVPGMRLSNCLGMSLTSNHFEWCGNGGLRMEACEDMALLGNQHLNHANGSGLTLTDACQRISVIGEKYRNADLYGGSGLGNMQLAINTPTSDLRDSVITGCSAHLMRDATTVYIAGTGNQTRLNIGFPDDGGMFYTTATRPSGANIGTQIFDGTINKPVWKTSSGWVDAAGNAV